jgi:LysM repeat protein
MDTESVPTIPKDARSEPATPVVVVPPVTEAEPLPQGSPLDGQLRERVRELRGEPATPEPALRFNAPSANRENLPMREAINLKNLLPNEVSPDAKDIESISSALSALENAPKPAWAEIRPAYREDQATQIDAEAETYTVQPGDTYITISDKFYGTSVFYAALAQHNQKLGIGWRLVEGTVLEIPSAEYLRLHYSEATNRQTQSSQPAIRYTVQEGDTIFRLATDKLRDSSRWREIYALNVDRLQDVRDLQPGMEILLPVETARVSRQVIR